MNAHLIQSFTLNPDRQGIVKVLGVAWVNGAGKHLAEVFPALHVLRRYLVAYLVGGILHLLRVFVWQAVLSQYGVHLHVVVAALAQHVNHLCNDGAVLSVGPLLHAYHGALVGLAAKQLVLWYEDIARHRLLRYEGSVVLVHLQAAHKLVLLP